MDKFNDSPKSSLHVSREVVAGIITSCITEVEGVHCIAPIMTSPGQLIRREQNFGNIRVGLVDDVLLVSLGIIIKGGFNVVNVSEAVQNKVKSSVQSMLGLTVAKVNVTVVDTAFSE